MKTFTYKGIDRSAAGDVALIEGESYLLNENDAHVKSLVAQKLLVPVEAEKGQGPKETEAVEETTNNKPKKAKK